MSHVDIELTQLCNLDCGYCYLTQLKSKGVITEEILLKCLEFCKVKKITNVNFYGGEPLLAFPQLKFFVEQAKLQDLKFEYLIVSNGTIYSEEIIAFCKLHRINIQRSVDGCPEAMALCRGEKTLEKYHEATKYWKDFNRTRRSTVIPETAKYMVKSLEYFAQLGFIKGISYQPDYYAKWTPETVDDFKKSLWHLARIYVADYRQNKKGFYTYWFERAMRMFQPNQKPAVGCGAGRTLWCITWDGYVYLCHRFVSEPRDSEFCLGTVQNVIENPNKPFGPSVQTSLAFSWNKLRPPECSKCLSQLNCDAGCYHVKHKTMGSMLIPNPVYCEFKREATKILLWMDTQLRTINPNWWHGTYDMSSWGNKRRNQNRNRKK